jgi:isopenicillin N synthase-like dioxygenase
MSATVEASIPVVDIAPLFLSNSPECDAVISALSAAVTSHGIFAITGHGIPLHVIDGALAASKASLEAGGPAETEQWEELEQIVSTRLPNEFKNFSSAGSENIGRFYNGNTEAPIELVSKFSVFPPSWEGDSTVAQRQPNIWPSTSNGAVLQEALERYYEEVQCVSDVLHTGLSQSLGKSRSFIKDMLGPYGHGILRALRYQCNSDAHLASAPALAAHKDLGTTTLLLSDALGLQFQPRDSNDWIDVVVPHGALVVNLGEFFEVWTGGAWHATLHRVSSSGRRGRTSLAFFSNQAIPLPRDGSAPEDRTIAQLDEINVVAQGAPLQHHVEWKGLGHYWNTETQKTLGWPSYFFDRASSLIKGGQKSNEGDDTDARAAKGGA